MLSDKDIIGIERLIALLSEVVNYLINDGSKETSYSGLVKSINILKNQEAVGFCNLNGYIMSDFRMMVDRGQYGGDIDAITDEICRLIKSNPLFNKN